METTKERLIDAMRKYNESGGVLTETGACLREYIHGTIDTLLDFGYDCVTFETTDGYTGFQIGETKYTV